MSAGKYWIFPENPPELLRRNFYKMVRFAKYDKRHLANYILYIIYIWVNQSLKYQKESMAQFKLFQIYLKRKKTEQKRPKQVPKSSD